MSFHGSPIVEGTDLTLNWGNRYGFIGRNGSGESATTSVRARARARRAERDGGSDPALTRRGRSC